MEATFQGLFKKKWFDTSDDIHTYYWNTFINLFQSSLGFFQLLWVNVRMKLFIPPSLTSPNSKPHVHIDWLYGFMSENTQERKS